MDDLEIGSFNGTWKEMIWKVGDPITAKSKVAKYDAFVPARIRSSF